MPTSVCLGHCMYCFRQDLLEEQHEKRQKEFQLDLDDLFQYLNAHPEVEEVILSGGDPLMLKANELDSIATKLSKIPSINIFECTHVLLYLTLTS